MVTYKMKDPDFQKLFEVFEEVKIQVSYKVENEFRNKFNEKAITNSDVINMLEAFHHTYVEDFEVIHSKCFVYFHENSLVLQFIYMDEDIISFLDSKLERIDIEKTIKELDASLLQDNEEFVPFEKWQENLYKSDDSEFDQDCLIYTFYDTSTSYQIGYNVKHNESEFYFHDFPSNKIHFCCYEREDLEEWHVYFAIKEEDAVSYFDELEVEYEKSDNIFAINLNLICARVDNILKENTVEIEHEEDQIWSVSKFIKEELEKLGFVYSEVLLHELLHQKGV